VPQKEQEEVPKWQTEDPIQEGAVSSHSEVELAKRPYCRYRRHKSGDSEISANVLQVIVNYLLHPLKIYSHLQIMLPKLSRES